MTTRAKFQVLDVLYREHEGVKNSILVKMYAVQATNEENKSFWKYTPSGNIEMTISNPDTFELFKPGKEFYIDFTEVPKELIK